LDNKIPNEEIILDEERQKKAKIYARIQRRLMLVELALGSAYILVWLFLGLSVWLKSAIMRYTLNPYGIVACFVVVFGGIYLLLSLPLTYYEGFVLPHRFELSNQTLKGWIEDQIKLILVGGILCIFIVEIIYAILRVSPEYWWLWVAGFLLFFNVILANLAPILLFPLFYKLEPLDEGNSDLEQRLLYLTEQAKTRVKGVYQFDMSRRTKAANAALVGLGNTRRIILGDTLLSEFSHDEIEVILAHELGHHVYKDIPMGILIESTITLMGLYCASFVLNWGTNILGFTSISDIAGLPLLLLVIGFYGLLTMPIGNAYSRWREKRADKYALHMTNNRSAFITAFTRLANQNLAEVDPEPWVEVLLHSHPSLKKRINMVKDN